MSREELLAEAKKRYPIGTVFKSPQTFRTYTVEKEDYWMQDDNVRINTLTHTSPFLYHDGKWGEIISKGEPQIINNYEIY